MVVRGDGFSCFQIDLQRPQDPLPVRGMKPGGGFRVDGVQLGQQRFDALPVRPGFQRLPDTGGGKGGKSVALDEGIHVKSRAAADNGGFSPGEDVIQNGRGHFTVPADREILRGFRHAEHIMGDPLHLFGGGLGGADIHALVYLHGITGDDLTVQRLCQGNGQRSFPGGSGTGNTDDGIHKTSECVMYA